MLNQFIPNKFQFFTIPLNLTEMKFTNHSYSQRRTYVRSEGAGEPTSYVEIKSLCLLAKKYQLFEKHSKT
jgi:hypothetical protein